jgi:hypothetical protein
MTLEEIKAAVEAGQTVHWASRCYIIVKDGIGQWMVHCPDTKVYWGLCKGDGTLSDKEDKFFLGVTSPKPKRKKKVKETLVGRWFDAKVVKVGRRFEVSTFNDYDGPTSILVTRKQLLKLADEILQLANS